MFTPNYKKMCEKAEEIQKEPDEFQRDIDYVYHPEENKEGIFVSYRENSVMTANKQIDLPISEFIWLPTENQIKDLARLQDLDLNKEALDVFLDDIHCPGYRLAPRGLFKSSEERWLAYYMHRVHKKYWLKQEWIEFE